MLKKSSILVFLLLIVSYSLLAQVPRARVDYDTADINTTLSVAAPGVLVNDTESGGAPITVAQFFVNGSVFNVGETANFGQGSITILADGSYTFVPRANYTGNVSTITYQITNGTFTSAADLLLTVEFTDNLLVVRDLGSCNQGFNANGEYKIKYSFELNNTSNARDFHETSLITNINITNNLEAAFGAGCVINVADVSIFTRSDITYVDTPYPLDFDETTINSAFRNASSDAIFNATATNLTLYPRQSIFVSYCVTVNPFCDGRPNPTPSGSGINFTNTVTVNSTKGGNSDTTALSDFHTTEAVVSAGLYVPEFHSNQDPPGVINSDGTYDYINTVVITNEGPTTAQNINFNMGLGDFQNKVTFNEIRVTQISGPNVAINSNFDGDNETTLLAANNTLPAGETIILEVFYLIGPVDSTSYSFFNQTNLSQTQSGLDGFDATDQNNKKAFSFVTWSDNLGNHLDRYYVLNSLVTSVSSALYCDCSLVGMRFLFSASSNTNKVITSTIPEPNGILEHEEITFQATIENTSQAVELDNLQLQENVNNVCGGNIISVSTPRIVSSSATANPILNPLFNGVSDTNIFDGSSGLLKIREKITIEYTVVFNEACSGDNTSFFSAEDPLGRFVSSSDAATVVASSDTDSDGITDDVDIDDDNDTIPDVLEYNGIDPLGDADNDGFPNYRDADFGADANADGIVDLFDFDNDGVPNHFDLDSENDGILDIVEAGNGTLDTSNNGRTNNTVGFNGLDNTIETNDSMLASIAYNMPNTDANGNPNFLDIDADDDGIVDNIEAQPTNNYTTLSGTISEWGIDASYPNGIQPVDTENDGIPDYIDINSDNDIRDDVLEGWDTNSDGTAEIIPSNSDIDNDGLDDAFDNDDNRLNQTNGQTPQSFPNADNVDNPERDWREIIAIVILINDITVTEGQDVTFTILFVTKNNNSILIESASPVDINFSTSNGTITTNVYDVATAPFDYSDFSNTVFTVPPFTNTAQFTVTSLEDNIYELTELFTLTGNVTSNNTLTTEFSGIATLLDNDEKPDITMNDSTEDEGVDLVHTIEIDTNNNQTIASSTPIEVLINTSDNLAISPDDYTTVSDVFTIAGTVDPSNPNTSVSVNITSILDNLNELDEEPLNVVGLVQTSNVRTSDLNKTATILDIDPKPLIQIDSVTVEEGNFMKFTISLLNDNDELMQNYLPINMTLETVDDTANANLDYETKSKQAIIPAFTELITQNINTLEDKLNEDTETFFLQANVFSSEVSNTFPPQGVGFIKDNDYPNLFSPNGDGKSDVFKISGIEDYPNFKLNIYNRQGNEVYNYSNNGNLNPVWWNGTYKGQPAPTGVYYYILDFNDGVKKPITKFIQLIR
ncbi:gliding motility-associated C-terminal domain-containing protein [Polaribacter sp. R77954]|uniref:T9SS type B sorting domain-containing protein n=1 Tax=Polaribacter sp. R77954 TaxID=3093870 RepID=UPI0037C91E4A